MTWKQLQLSIVATWGGFVVVWSHLPRVQLLALLSGSDSSGVARVSGCAVWVPPCIGCMCLVAWLCDVWLVSLPRLSGGYLCTFVCVRYLTVNCVQIYQWLC